MYVLTAVILYAPALTDENGGGIKKKKKSAYPLFSSAMAISLLFTVTNKVRFSNLLFVFNM